MDSQQKKPETPEERRARLLAQLERGREESAKRKQALIDAGLDPKNYRNVDGEIRQSKPSVRQLSKIVQEVLADEKWIDRVIQNQPGWWEGLPVKNAAYIMTTAIATMAMSGNMKAADWIRKTGFGDKVTIEADDDSFFGKPEFTIKVIAPTVADELDQPQDPLMLQHLNDVIEGEEAIQES